MRVKNKDDLKNLTTLSMMEERIRIQNKMGPAGIKYKTVYECEKDLKILVELSHRFQDIANALLNDTQRQLRLIMSLIGEPQKESNESS